MYDNPQAAETQSDSAYASVGNHHVHVATSSVTKNGVDLQDAFASWQGIDGAPKSENLSSASMLHNHDNISRTEFVARAQNGVNNLVQNAEKIQENLVSVPTDAEKQLNWNLAEVARITADKLNEVSDEEEKEYWRLQAN